MGAWSGCCRQGAQSGEDLGEQVVVRWQAQGERFGVVDQAGGDADQAVPQGGDHGLALADAPAQQRALGGGGGGELV